MHRSSTETAEFHGTELADNVLEYEILASLLVQSGMGGQ